MYRVMIVEDEIIVRVWLKSMINWERLGLKVVADTGNGKEALQLYEEYKPEIIITDLRMPIMGGMELIREIRKTDKTTRVIILTCLDEFAILKEAISLDVSGYVLKLSSEVDEIECELKKVTEELESNEKVLKNIPWVDQSMILDQIIRDFIIYQKIPVEAFIQCIEMFSLNFKPRMMRVIMLRLQGYDRIKKEQNDLRGQHIRKAVLDILQQTLEHFKCGHASHDYKADFILLTSFDGMDIDQADEMLDDLYNALCDNISTYLACEVRVGISDMADGYTCLPALRQQALDMINHGTQEVPVKLSAALDFINSHYAEDLSLQAVADYVGVTSNYLGHLFRQHLGDSFCNMLNGIRIEQAKKLLANPSYRVYEIAEKVGFFNTNYFFRLFKRLTGLTPNEYRAGRFSNE